MALSDRKTILVFADWFVPGTHAGGPIRSVYSLVKLLNRDYRFKIFTRNTDHNSSVPYAGIRSDEWIKFDEGIEVYYCSEQNLNKQTLERLLEDTVCHKIYLNSFYSKWFSIVPLQLIRKRKESHKVILAPRGMLGKGALQVKALKKKLFIVWAKLTGLHQNITWQASSENEKNDIVAVFGSSAKVKIAGNLSYIEQLPYVPRQKKNNELSMFFLSRLVPIKNLHIALHALKNVQDEIRYDIFGPVEDEKYYQECLSLVQSMPANIKVEFKGVLPNEEIQQRLQEYHVLLMPTLNENFGHSILESFCAGCPVIISDQTPWHHLEAQRVGFNVNVFGSSVMQELASAINFFASTDESTFNTWSSNAYHYGLAYQNENLQREASVALFA